MLFLFLREDTIKNSLVKELNNQINTKVDVASIDLGLIRHFPAVTLSFNHIIIYSPQTFRLRPSLKLNADTLLTASEFYFKINPFKLIKKQIFLNSFRINDARVNIVINKKGENNYQILKEKKDTTASEFSFDIRSATLSRLHIVYNNLASGLKAEGLILDEKAVLSGNYSLISSNGKFIIQKVLQNKDLILNNKSLSVILEMKRQEKYLDILSGKINFSGLSSDISGKIDFTDKIKVNLHFTGSENRFKNLISTLPEKKKQNIKNLKMEGIFDFSGTINGVWSNGKYPNIKADFGLKNGKLKDRKTGFTLSANFKGKVTNGKRNNSTSTSLTIPSFSIVSGGKILKGSYSVKNLENPAIRLSLNGAVNLDEFKKIIPDTLASDLGGLVKLDMKMSGNMKDLKKITAADMQKMNLTARLELQNVRYRFPGRTAVYSNASGYVKLNEALLLDSISIRINDNPMNLTATLRNFWPYLDHKKGILSIKGSINSPGFNLTDLFNQSQENSSDRKDSTEIRFPKAILANISLKADALSYRKFHCKEFTGHLNYQSEKLSLNPVSFKSMDGRATGKAVAFEITGGKILTRANVEFSDIDIKKLFHQMGNFRQTFIVEENLTGIANGNILYSSEWYSGLSLDPGSVIVNGHYVIENGKLVHFKPIESLSRFISLSELKNIRFSTLENDIYIQDQVIYIPNMGIQSSAFNINASGTHDFNNLFDYHLKVLLSEVLASKARKKKKQNQEFGIIEEDGQSGISIPVRIAGTPDDFKVTYSRKGIRKGLRKSVEEERKLLKQIFQAEFNKNDEKVPLKSNKNAKKKFNISWDETTIEKKDTLKSKSKFKISWDEAEVPDSSIKKF